MHAFYINTSSYQNNFSTFLRTTRNQELLGQIDRDDDGMDPLPVGLGGGGGGGWRLGWEGDKPSPPLSLQKQHATTVPMKRHAFESSKHLSEKVDVSG